jgi:hypothetical protein
MAFHLDSGFTVFLPEQDVACAVYFVCDSIGMVRSSRVALSPFPFSVLAFGVFDPLFVKVPRFDLDLTPLQQLLCLFGGETMFEEVLDKSEFSV